MRKFILTLLGFRTDFETLFFQNEYKALAGAKRNNILAMLSILLVTFLALGFAIGSMANLSKKMKDPFTNWVNLNIYNNELAKKSPQIQARYNDPEQKEAFHIRLGNGFSRYERYFYQREFSPFNHPYDTLRIPFWGRTVELEEPLFAHIINPRRPDNLRWIDPDLVAENGSLQWDHCNIIVTESMWRALGHSESPNQATCLGLVERRRTVDDTANIWLPVKVVAIVKELPDADFVGTPGLYNAFADKKAPAGNFCRDGLIRENVTGNNVFLMLTESKASFARIKDLANDFFTGRRPSLEITKVFTAESVQWLGFELRFLPIDAPAIKELRAFVEFAVAQGVPLAERSAFQCHATVCPVVKPADYHYLAFHFDQLKSIRSFGKDLKANFGAELDMRQVESKENFALVSNLTFGLALILLGFGMLSIVLFVNNLLRAHLYEVRSNLGTFQAFGLDNDFLIRTYLKIVFSFLAIAIGIAWVLSWGVAVWEAWWFQAESKLDVINIYMLVAIIGLVSVSLIIAQITVRQLLQDTPGNLIYER